MKLNSMFLEREHFQSYYEKTFLPFELKIDVVNPILFLSNKEHTLKAEYFNLDSIEERNYDIHIVSSQSLVIFYIISVKAPYFTVLRNGLILRNRIKWDEKTDQEGIETRYTFEDFHIIANKTKSCEIFCRNITTDQKT